nr:MAG TPA: hypothetical protein [Caudoviricetes sp.]
MRKMRWLQHKKAPMARRLQIFFSTKLYQK